MWGTLLTAYGAVLGLLMWDLCLRHTLEPGRFLLFCPLINHLPCMLVLACLSQYRNGRISLRTGHQGQFCLLRKVWRLVPL